MKILFVSVGKLRSAPLRKVCDEYLGRLQRYGTCEVLETKPAKAKDPAAAAREESAGLLAALSAGDKVWVLDERGTQETSPGLARRISELENRSAKRLAVLLGGAYGLDDSARARADWVWSLSKGTFAHELCRALALEQLYRARTIQRGEPYHHGGT